MKLRFLVRAAIVTLTLGLLTAPSQAATIFDFTFDDTPNANVTPPIVGTGTLTLGNDLGDGTFAYASLAPTMSFAFDNGQSFTEANLVTPAANILIRIQSVNGQRFINFGGSRGGPFAGSMDFEHSTGVLSFQPDFGSLFFNASEFGTYQGIAPAVPEPSTLVLAGTCLVGLVVRVRRRRHAIR